MNLLHSLPVTPPVPHDGGGLLPGTFDGRRRGTKALDCIGFDGMTLRDKKLLQFRDKLVKRRKQLNMRQNTAQQNNGVNNRSIIDKQRSIERQQAVFSAAHEPSVMEQDSLMWGGPDDLLNLSRGSIQMNLEINNTKHTNTFQNLSKAQT